MKTVGSYSVCTLAVRHFISFNRLNGKASAAFFMFEQAHITSLNVKSAQNKKCFAVKKRKRLLVTEHCRHSLDQFVLRSCLVIVSLWCSQSGKIDLPELAKDNGVFDDRTPLYNDHALSAQTFLGFQCTYM